MASSAAPSPTESHYARSSPGAGGVGAMSNMNNVMTSGMRTALSTIEEPAHAHQKSNSKFNWPDYDDDEFNK